MLKQVHEHIVHELQQNTRTDTIFVVTAIAFKSDCSRHQFGHRRGGRFLPAGSIQRHHPAVVFIVMSLLVNSIATVALNTGKASRKKLITGLLAMYTDNDVAKYYDASLMKGLR